MIVRKGMADKVIHLNSIFKKDGVLPTAGDAIDSIYIEGYANTTSTDRSGYNYTRCLEYWDGKLSQEPYHFSTA